MLAQLTRHQVPSPPSSLPYFAAIAVELPSQLHQHFRALTRSHKYNERDHAGLKDGTATAEDHLPRYFAKSGHAGEDPKKVKKDGSGKANWGAAGDEVEDGGYNLNQPRRRSNSSTTRAADFKTKFETIDPEPVFEEEIHGDNAVEVNEAEHGDGETMTRYDTSSKSSASEESVDEGIRKL